MDWIIAVGVLILWFASYRIGYGDGDRNGYVRGYIDGTHGRKFKRVRRGGTY